MNESWRYCRDCAAATFRCWRHSQWVEVIPAITIPATVIVIPAITLPGTLLPPTYMPTTLDP